MTGLLLSLSCIVLASAGGFLLTYSFYEHAPLWVRTAFGVSIGMVGFALLTFFLAWWLGLSGGIIGLAALATFLIPLVVSRKYLVGAFRQIGELPGSLRSSFRTQRRWTILVLAYALLMSLLLGRIFLQGVFEHNGDIGTGMVDNFADITIHLGIVDSFLYGDNFPPEHPIMATKRLSYPFLADFTVALFLKLGMSYQGAFFLHNMMTALALAALLGWFARLLTNSRAAGLLTPVLLFFNGGMGWTMLFDESAKEGGLLALLRNLPHDYTSNDEPYRWNNSLVYWFVPMRSMLLAVPMMCAIWILWWRAITAWRQDSTRSQMRMMLAAGILAGLMPIIHTHSFLAMMGTAAILALLYRRWREWLLFFVPACLVAAPLVALLASGTGMHTGNFFAWQWGWTKGDHNFLWYWFLNAGLFIPALIFSIVWLRRKEAISRDAVMFYAPFTLWFIIPNIARLAPWDWDNIKILYIWFLGSLPFVAALLAYAWKKGAPEKLGAALLLVFLSLSGALDLYRQIVTPPAWGVYSSQDRDFAAALRKETPPKSLFMTAPIHNTPVLLTGRRLVMAYSGTIWTNGMSYEETERDIRNVYEGSPDAIQILRRHKVNYLLLTSREFDWARDTKLTISEQFLNQFPHQEFPAEDPTHKNILYFVDPLKK